MPLIPFDPLTVIGGDPDETALTDSEINFTDDEPPNLFPQNQTSVWGIKRKVFSDQAQIAYDQLHTIYSERFVPTSTNYLDVWEKEVGLPVSSGLDILARRARIEGRLNQGPFTRTRRKQIVEKYIEATFGEVPSFGIDGIPIPGTGITLHAPAGDVAFLYTIVENVPNFSYLVTIDSTITVDMTGLTRELKFITPAGITFTIQYSGLGGALGDGHLGDGTLGDA